MLNFNKTATDERLEGDAHSLRVSELTREALAPYGLGLFNLYCNGEWPIEKALDYFSKFNIGVPAILSGQARYSDEFHSVVVLDGQIIHDPSGAGISGPCGEWWHFDVIAVSSDWSALRAPVERKGELQAIKDAPYDTPVEVQAGRMTFHARLLANHSVDENEQQCDQWVAEHEDEHPPCWTDGACWESNANEEMSIQPTGWRHLRNAAGEKA